MTDIADARPRGYTPSPPAKAQPATFELTADDQRLPAALDTLTDLCERMRTHADALDAEAKRDRELEHYIRQLVESLDPKGTLRKG